MIVIRAFHILLMTLLLSTGLLEQSSKDRKLFIFCQEQNEVLAQQLQLMNEDKAGLEERDIKIVVVEKGNLLVKRFKVKAAEFTVILVGKDGTEKYRTNKLLQPAFLFAIIDAMPLRKVEMNKKK